MIKHFLMVFFLFFSSSYAFEFKTGDLIFQTSTSKQSYAIMWATQSPFSHMGIIVRKEKKVYVLEASATVRMTPLKVWISKGVNGHYALKRNSSLSPQIREEMIAYALKQMGKAYDKYFLFDSTRFYCSELPYKAFKKANIEIGKVETLQSLKINNILIEKLIKNRWRSHPHCQEKNLTYASCKKKILQTKLITPGALYHDLSLTLIYSNYPL